MMIKIFFASLICTASVSLYAADVPSIDLGADKFNAIECLRMFQDECINAQCMHSEETDCQDKCRALAADKCKENIEE